MTIDMQTAQPTITEPITEPEQQFNWRECWYPVGFRQDLPPNKPYGFSLYDEPFVIYRNKQGKLVCLTDRCPHRAAKLSSGQIIDGRLECLYHGWQFNSQGKCLHIPQIQSDAKIPTSACVKSFAVIEKQGMIWVWAGEAEAANEEDIPTIPNLYKPGFVYNDKISELPVDIGYVIEHMLDPAHIHIAHANNQGNRLQAQPLEMEVIESSVKGFRGRFRDTREAEQTWRNLDFVVPSLAHLHFPIPERGWFFGQAFYFFPLGKGRTRILTRSYRNFVTWQVKLMPRWWIHLKQNQILVEDLALLSGQQQEVERLGQNIQQVYYPLTTCDTFAVEYRRWVDQFGASLPFYRGYNTLKVSQTPQECNQLLAQRIRHTQLCSSCNGTYKVTKKIRNISMGLALALAAVAIVTSAKIVAGAASLVAVILAFIADQLKAEFERF